MWYEEEPRLVTRKMKAGSYAVVVAATNEKVGEIHKTGTHLDDYPWDWHFDLSRGWRNKIRTSGVSDTLKSAKEIMNFEYGRLGPQEKAG